MHVAPRRDSRTYRNAPLTRRAAISAPARKSALDGRKLRERRVARVEPELRGRAYYTNLLSRCDWRAESATARSTNFAFPGAVAHGRAGKTLTDRRGQTLGSDVQIANRQTLDCA